MDTLHIATSFAAPTISTACPRPSWSSSKLNGTRRPSKAPCLSRKESGNRTLKISYSIERMMPVPNASYAAPIDSSSVSYMIRPLAEILRDMNKRIPDLVLKRGSEGIRDEQKYIPWYQANRMLSFYAPGWCGEVRSITFSSDGKFITVVYRVILRGSDGEAYREASGTVCMDDTKLGDPIQRAESVAFCRACERFGLGLYLHHEADSL